MRLDAPPPDAIVSQETTAAITLGGRVLAGGIPVESGRLAIQVDQDVPQKLDLALPHEWDQYTIDPTRPAAVLGSDGHRIEVTTTLSDGQRSWVLPMSSYLVDDWDVDKAGVHIRASGLLTLVGEHERARPKTIAAVSPAVSEIMSLLWEDGLEPVVHDGVSALRSVPAGFEIGEDRLTALLELATAIPCRVRQGWDGAIHILPATSESLTPVLTWSNEPETGTIVTPAASGSRKDLYSHFVVPWSREVTTVGPDGEETTEKLEGIVDKYVTSGRLDHRIFGPRTRHVESDAITTHAQAQAVATNEAARAHLRARTLEVTMAADLRAEIDDPVAVITDGVRSVGRVTGIEYPLTPRDGDMAATVGVPA